MNYRSLVILALILGVGTLIVVACAAPAASTPAAVPTKAPAAVDTSAPSRATGAVEAGKAVFEANCNGCHPGGQAGVGPDIRGRSVSVVKAKVRSGGGGMPSFPPSQINDQQIEDVAAYVNSLK